MTKDKLFIISLGGSGTSFLRRVLVENLSLDLWFDPYPVFYAGTLTRTLLEQQGNKYLHMILNDFEKNADGAKIALKPHYMELEWMAFAQHFPNANYIFMKRNFEDAHKSLCQAELHTIAGSVSEAEYILAARKLIKSFEAFHRNYRDSSIIIDYDKMIIKDSNEIDKIVEFTGVDRNVLSKSIKPPHNLTGLNR